MSIESCEHPDTIVVHDSDRSCALCEALSELTDEENRADEAEGRVDDLAEALEDILDHADRGGLNSNSSTLDMARTAIAKAKETT
jgi:hypothetical protein